MTPILSTVIKSDKGSIEAACIRAYLDNLIESSPALLPYRYAVWFDQRLKLGASHFKRQLAEVFALDVQKIKRHEGCSLGANRRTKYVVQEF